MPNPNIAALTKGNRLPLILGVGGAAFLATQLLKMRSASSAPGVPGAPLASGDLAALLLQAQGAGANAAIAGFEPGANVAIAGLGVAQGLGSDALYSLAGVASQLAGSQAGIAAAGLGVISDLGLGILGVIGQGQLGGGWTPGPVTNPPVTSPPVSQPPVQQPPIGSFPPVTTPPVVNPPVTPPTGGGAASYLAIFTRPTTVWSRTADGFVGAGAVFGQPGLQIHVNPIVVPSDAAHPAGGSYWRMTEGAKTGWLIAQHDPNVTIVPLSAAAAQSGYGSGTQGQILPINGQNYSPALDAYQYVGALPGTFSPAPLTQYQTALDLGAANVNNPQDVAYIAANYYQGNTAAAQAGIVNAQAAQSGDWSNPVVVANQAVINPVGAYLATHPGVSVYDANKALGIIP